MSIILLLVVCLVCSVAITPLKYRSITNTIFLFVLEWIVVMLLANQQWYGLYDVSVSVEQIVLVGVVSFLCGSFISVLLRRYKFTIRMNVECTYSVKYLLLYFLLVICII